MLHDIKYQICCVCLDYSWVVGFDQETTLGVVIFLSIEFDDMISGTKNAKCPKHLIPLLVKEFFL
jgi:hypothetical protein